MKIVKYVMTIAIPENASESMVIDEVRDMFKYAESIENSECSLCSVELVKMEGEE